MKITACVRDFLVEDTAIYMLSYYVSVLLSFQTTCILSIVLFLVLFPTWDFGISSYVFLLCHLNLTKSGLSIFSKFSVMPLSPYVHSILISNANSKSFPFKALCSFVYSVSLHSPLFLKVLFQNLPLHTTSAFCNITCLKLQVKPFLVLCSEYKS